MIFIKQRSRIWFLKPLLYISPAIIGVAILWLSTMNPLATEEVYSRRIFPIVTKLTRLFSGILPVSLAGLLVISAAIGAVVLLIGFVVGICRTQFKQKMLIRWLKGISLTLSSIFLGFVLTCGPNYYRLTFGELTQLEVRPSQVSELTALCTILVENANLRAEAAGEPPHREELLRTSKAAFDGISGFDFIGKSYSSPKPMVFSQILSYLNITGFYFPYTAEATINGHIPPMEMPFTACHELAHTRGFMREDEANFIAYLACLESEEPYIAYSGALCALNHSMNALYMANSEEYFKLRVLYNERLTKDLEAQGLYWSRYDTPAATVSEAVNNVYLKVNNQSDGTRSYGRMVDLLLAYYRK